MAQAPTLPAAPGGAPSIIRGNGSVMQAFPGGASGRVVAADGTISFVLGLTDYQSLVEMNTGDYVEIYQLLPLDAYDKAVFDASVAIGLVLPGAGVAWHAKILVDDVELATQELVSLLETDDNDVVAPIRRYTGLHCLAFRLELV